MQITKPIQWFYYPEHKPKIPDDLDSVVVMACRKRYGKTETWLVHYDREKGWIALRGHSVKNIYAWAYLPEPAPEFTDSDQEQQQCL